MYNEIMPLYKTLMVEFYDENPYEVKETETGLKLTTGMHESPDSGELEKKDTWYRVAKVLEVGPGGNVDGKEIEMQVKKGDKVIVSKYAGTEVKYEGEEYIIVRQSDVLAIVE